MRLATIETNAGSRACAVVGNTYVDLAGVDDSLPSNLRLILQQHNWHGRVQAACKRGPFVSIEGVRYAAPIVDPQKVICLGLNYRDHAIESKMAIPEEPVVFSKFPSALVGHGAAIELPDCSDQVDYEAELVVVIGARGRDIPQAEAMRHVAGYCVGHDVSARDWQLHKPGKQWLSGKTFDTFAPIGPHLVTRDEVADPHNLRIQLRLNGATMQDSSTAQLIFRIDEVIAYLSRVCTLEAGDLIFTGTPPGVGMARTPPVFLKAGDSVEVEIEGLGILKNAVRGRSR